LVKAAPSAAVLSLEGGGSVDGDGSAAGGVEVLKTLEIAGLPVVAG
jgi:hypothetical protein